MSHIGKGYDINQTFVIESADGEAPIFSACTGVYTNEIISCSGDTQIQLGSSVIRFIGDGSFNDSLSATTFYGDGSNLTGIIVQDIFVTGGTYNTITGVATFINNTGGTFSVSGFSTSNATSFTGGTVTGATYFTNGLSANTISGSTYLGLPLDVFVTGGTYNLGVATFTNNTGGTFNINGFYTGATDVFVTGGTYSNGNAIFTNNTGGTFTVSGFSTSNATSFTGGTVTGSTFFTNGLSANTFSATTYLGLPLDVFVTGATLNQGSGIAIFTNNTGGTFSLSGLTFSGGGIDTYVTGFTYSSDTFYIYQNNDEPVLSASVETTSLSGALSSVTFNILTTGNITAGNFYGNGSNLSGITTTDSYTTAFTYNNSNVLTLSRNNGLSALTATINSFSGLTINNSLTINSLSGSTDRMVEVNSSGLIDATKPIISAYISSGSTAASLLINDLNWDIDGVYTGSTISDTYMGQKYYNLKYFYEAVDDNLWIRLIRG